MKLMERHFCSSCSCLTLHERTEKKLLSLRLSVSKFRLKNIRFAPLFMIKLCIIIEKPVVQEEL